MSLLTKLAATADTDEPPTKKIKTSPSTKKILNELGKKETASPKLNTLDGFISIKDSKKVDGKRNKNLDTDESDDRNKESKKRKYKEEYSSNDDEIIETESSKKDGEKIKLESNESITNSSSYHENTSTDTPEKENKKNEYTNEITLQLLPSNPLPDVFKDKRLGFYPDFISFSDDERDLFERHWVAYGGTVVKTVRSLDVDFIVHKNETIDYRHMLKLKKKVEPNVKHVNKNWIIQCINDVVLHDTTKYPVIVEP